MNTDMNNSKIIKNAQLKDHPLKPIDILEVLSQKSGSMGIIEMSAITGLSKSTLHRILAALVERQYVIKDDETKKYRLGYKILTFSANLLDTVEIKALAKPELIRLSIETGETIHLVCLDVMEGVYIDKIDTSKSVGLLSNIGKRLPLYCTGAGKVLLAYQSDKKIQKYINTVELKKFTPNTIDTKEMLLNELDQIRRQGFALDEEEHHENINCISVPILRSDEKIVAAISISAPAYRFSIKDALSYKDLLINEANLISAKL